jgi:hypothetical protein
VSLWNDGRMTGEGMISSVVERVLRGLANPEEA